MTNRHANEAVQVALVGCGNISRDHARGYRARSDIKVVAVCDISRHLAEERASELGEPPIFTAYQEVLEQSGIEAVDVCLPHYLHAEVAIAAARAGKHVFVEKPMATTYAEARAMADAARQAGVVLMVGHHQRYMADHRRLKQLIDAGALGHIFCARADCNQYLSAEPGDQPWLHSRQQAGGGVVISLAVHKLDLLRWFIGEIEEVASFHRTALVAMDGEDVSVTSLRFANGCLGEMISLYAAKKAPWGESFILYGTKGSAHNLLLNHYEGPVMLWQEDAGDHASSYNWLGVPLEDPFVNELGHFAECIRTGATPLTSGEDAAKTMQVISSIYKAAQTGQVVRVQEVTL